MESTHLRGMRLSVSKGGFSDKVTSNPTGLKVQGVPKKMSYSDFLVIAASAI